MQARQASQVVVSRAETTLACVPLQDYNPRARVYGRPQGSVRVLASLFLGIDPHVHVERHPLSLCLRQIKGRSYITREEQISFNELGNRSGGLIACETD